MEPTTQWQETTFTVLGRFRPRQPTLTGCKGWKARRAREAQGLVAGRSSRPRGPSPSFAAQSKRASGDPRTTCPNVHKVPIELTNCSAVTHAIFVFDLEGQVPGQDPPQLGILPEGAGGPAASVDPPPFPSCPAPSRPERRLTQAVSISAPPRPSSAAPPPIPMLPLLHHSGSALRRTDSGEEPGQVLTTGLGHSDRDFLHHGHPERGLKCGRGRAGPRRCVPWS